MADFGLVSIISEKLVKPSSPTPPSSKYYKLCVFDAYLLNKLVNMAFFYHKEGFHGINPCMEVLEASLAKTLDYYYPFAGRLMDDEISIDCNDAGVQLREVHINASMSEILDPPADENAKNVVFPQEMYCYNSSLSRVLVQLNHFMCDSIGIGICMSHELGDAKTLSNFVNDWAAIARASHNIHPSPSIAPIFPGASIFPPLDHSFFRQISSSTFMDEKVTTSTRRFVFFASSISKLKKIVIEDDLEIEYPSKVEVVTALIFKSAVLAFEKIQDSFTTSSLSHAVNFRPLTGLPYSENYVGNLIAGFSISVTEIQEVKLSRLITKMRKSKEEVQDMFRSASREGNELLPLVSRYWKENGEKFLNKNIQFYVFSSWCKFPIYKVDLGWGKPIYVISFLSDLLEKGIILMDTPDGDGIEAIITLKQEHMSIFQNDPELLAFANLNPNICVPN